VVSVTVTVCTGMARLNTFHVNTPATMAMSIAQVILDLPIMLQVIGVGSVRTD